MNTERVGISTVARETGFSKEILRVWERRYGFPTPERDAAGDRLYRTEDIAKLRSIRRLMDQGLPPRRLVALSPRELDALLIPASPEQAVSSECQEFLRLVHECKIVELRRLFKQRATSLGLQRFVLDIARPLTEMVGLEWERGTLDVFQEHLFTEALQWVLREAAVSAAQSSGSPIVVLSTPPGERHGLGLLMVEAILTTEGALCVPLGVDLPLANLARISARNRIDIVALSLSAAYPADQAATVLRDIRGLLPATIDIWTGGAGALRVKGRARMVKVIDGLESIAQQLKNWRDGNSR